MALKYVRIFPSAQGMHAIDSFGAPISHSDNSTVT